MLNVKNAIKKGEVMFSFNFEKKIVGKTSKVAMGFVIGWLILLLASCQCPSDGITSPTESIEVESVFMISAEDGEVSNYFGYVVAISGNTAVVGARWDDDNGDNSGSAYVFDRNGNSWVQQAKLTNSDGSAGDVFGDSVAISGSTVIIGSYLDDDNGDNSGSAYVFVRNGNTWVQQAKLTNSDGSAGDFFGSSVAINGDNVIVGAYRADGFGSAYVFTRSGEAWSEQAKLTNSDTNRHVFDAFGFDVAIDGNTVVVSATGEDNHKFNSGSAYVFVRNGSAWSQQAKLTNANLDDNDSFGESVALDGNIIVVGAEGDDDNGNDSGSAFVFVRENGGNWLQETRLTTTDAKEINYFGNSVAVSGDVIVVGAYKTDVNGTDSGSAYVFSKRGGVWAQHARLISDQVTEFDLFGHSVALNGDTVIVGAYKDDDDGIESGSAYLFQLNR